MTSHGAPPLGVYIHWPYCARICPYCDFNVVRDRGRREEQAALFDAIADDLRGQAAMTGPRTLVSIFFGGGTPSLMDPAWAAQLIALAPQPLDARARTVEVTLEANPTDAEADRFAGLRRRGRAAAVAGRAGAGRCAASPSSAATTTRRRRRAAARGGRAGLPAPVARPDLRPAGPDAARLEPTPCAAPSTSGAEHLSPYQLTIEAGTAFDRAVRRGRFAPADPDLAARLYETTQAVLEAEGFDAYEVSNHARGAAARSRHNLVYWRGEDYVGAGPGAHGRLTARAGAHRHRGSRRGSPTTSPPLRARGWASPRPSRLAAHRRGGAPADGPAHR